MPTSVEVWRIIAHVRVIFLSIEDIKNLARVSRKYWECFKEVIEDHLVFRVYPWQNIRFLRPRNISLTSKRACTFRLQSYTTNLNILSFIEHEDPLRVDSYITPNITCLSLGCYFNQPLDNLPNSLRNLKVNLMHSEYSLDHLPPYLTHLSAIINEKLESLDHLPASLAYLSITMEPHERVKLSSVDYLPDSLQELEIRDYVPCAIDHLPKSLSSLKLITLCPGVYLDHLPPVLQSLEVSSRNALTYFADHLPSTIKSLSLGPCFNIPLDNLPNSLQHLSLFGSSHPLDNLPPNLLSLTFRREDDNYTHPMDNLPEGLLSLKFQNWGYVQKLDHLPASLLVLEGYFVRSHYLPAAVQPGFNEMVDELAYQSMVEDAAESWDHIPEYYEYAEDEYYYGDPDSYWKETKWEDAVDFEGAKDEGARYESEAQELEDESAYP